MKKSEILLAGLDIGSTGSKVTVYRDNGSFLERFYEMYPVRRTLTAHEVDATEIWATVQRILRRAAAKYPEIAGIGVSSFGETFVLLDEYDTPLMPAMLYTDPRGENECKAFSAQYGQEKILQTTGVRPAATYSLPKLLWIKNNRPETYERAKKILLIGSYIVYMLTGRAVADYSLAARTMLFDIHQRCWSEGLLAAAGVEECCLPETVEIGSTAGVIRPELASALGLKSDIMILAPSHDQMATVIGSGTVDESCAVESAGTVECVSAVFGKYDAAVMAEGNYPVVPYLSSGQFVTYAYSYTGGALVEWYVNQMAGYAAEEAKRRKADIHHVLEGGIQDSPTGILVLPHFAGAAMPYMDAGSKGVIAGLTVAHTDKDLYCACLEGICYEMRVNIEHLREAGVAVSRLHATGGGAQSKVWMQMKADVLNIPIAVLETGEAGATGSAMLAGIALGVFRNLAHAAAEMLNVRKTFYPRAMQHEMYTEAYRRYQKLYEAVRPLMT